MSARRFSEYKSYHNSFILLPYSLWPDSYRVYFYSGHDLLRQKMLYYFITVIFYGLLVFIVTIISLFFGKNFLARSRGFMKWTRRVAPVLLCLVFVYSYRDMDLGMRGALMIAGMLGFCIGVWNIRGGKNS